ncbi:MAG TPA: hypothetical protein VE973_01420, partial [Candidatus Limnocylindria bacterium]|nr:hypothetical protein [Candidatus Limnocylindria bacterium]
EGKKGRLALAQSKAYIEGRWWKVFGRVVLLQVLFLVPYILLQIISSTAKNSGITIVVAIASFIFQFLYTYYLLAYNFTLYKQLRDSAGPTEPQKYLGSVTGWAIWGAVGGVLLLIVIPLGISIVLLSLNSARALSRDAKRVSDAKQMSSALEMYFKDNKAYPNTAEELVPAYLPSIPTAPTPRDGDCTDEQNTYTYTPSPDKHNYSLDFCLGKASGGYSAGPHTISALGIDAGDTKQDSPILPLPTN